MINEDIKSSITEIKKYITKAIKDIKRHSSHDFEKNLDLFIEEISVHIDHEAVGNIEEISRDVTSNKEDNSKEP